MDGLYHLALLILSYTRYKCFLWLYWSSLGSDPGWAAEQHDVGKNGPSEEGSMHCGAVSYCAKTPRPGFYQKAPWCQPGKPATKPRAPREETISSKFTSPNTHLPKLNRLQPLCSDSALTAYPFTQIWAIWQKILRLWGRREQSLSWGGSAAQLKK